MTPDFQNRLTFEKPDNKQDKIQLYNSVHEVVSTNKTYLNTLRSISSPRPSHVVALLVNKNHVLDPAARALDI